MTRINLRAFGAARPISRAEITRLRYALPWRDSLAVAIMADTGLRVSDVLSIRREQLARTMRVTERKTGKMRRVRLSPSTLQSARAYITTHNSPYVIPCTRSTVWRSIVSTARALGYEHISPHSLRKYYAVTYCRRHGLTATQQELQHANMATTVGYVTDPAALAALIPGKPC